MKKILFRDSLKMFMSYLENNEYSNQTIIGYQKDLNKLIQWLETKKNGPVYNNEVCKEDIQKYLEEMRGRGCSASTRNRVMYVLRSYYSFINDETLNPVEEIKPVKTRIKKRTYLQKEEVEKLVETIEHPTIRFTVLTAYYTGLRPSELLNLHLEDVDLKSDLIHVKQGKGNKDRDIPICEDLKLSLLQYLEEYRPEVASEKFFATARSGSLSMQFLNRKIGEAVRHLKWKKSVTAHTLRHSFASRLVAKDVNIAKIQHLLGHSNITVTSLYAHFTTKELSEALKKL